ncbi:MAG: hypothetical protein ACLQE9_19560 [Roseiarcus sp.]
MRRAVLQWPGRPKSGAAWTNDELAELYRVEHALNQAAIAVETDRGVSDEGDPWFVFCHPDGQVVVHIVRMDGLYHLFCATLPQPLAGPSFAALTKAYVATIPRPQASTRTGVVVAHPSALLSLLVAAAMVSVDALLQHPAQANEPPAAPHGDLLSGHHVHSGAAKDAAIRAFTETFAAAVWRGRGADGAEGDAAWRAVEQAALAFAALYEADLPLAVAPSAAWRAPTIAVPESSGPQAGAAESREARLWTDQAGDETAAVAGAPGRDVVASAAKAQPALANLQPTLAAGLIGAINAGGEGVGAGFWRPAPLTGVGKTAGALSVMAALPAADLAPISAAARDLTVTLAGAGESLDLAPGELWSLVISGQGGLTLVNAGAADSIDVSSRTTAEITLIYDAASSSALAPQKLTLDGATHVSLTEGSSPETQPTRLVVDSQGAKGNELNILDTPGGGPAEFSLKVIGGESLTLQESAASFGASRLDASKLSGALTVGIDFSDGATDLSLGSGNFVVKAQDSVALENLGDNATIQIDVDLNSVILGFARGASAAAAPIALALDLGAPGQSAPVSIGLIDADDVSALSIVSSGGANAVQTIIDPALTSLEVSGGGALEIDAIRGVKAVDSSSLVIDASGLDGFLTLDAGAIGDLAAGGRQVSIALGAGGGAITDMAASEAVTVALGTGPGLLYLADGATHVAIAGLISKDQVNVGAATVADAFVNGLGLSSSQQTSIDASASLLAAASAAATMAGAATAHQAVLFSYRGDSYVFVDVAGNHVFDQSLDAIIKLVGVLPTTDLAGVFHSA